MMKRLLPFVLLAGAMSPFACAAAPALPLDDRQALIETLLERMTLAEKIGQLRLISIGGDMPRERIVEEIAAGRIGATFNSVTRADNRPMQDAALRSRLGIPIFFAYDVVHGHRTIFPISLALASSWDLDAIALSGRVSAIEASADGLDLTFAPMVDITRDPRWGRTSEGFGEDPYLVSQIAGTLVRAYQGERLSAADSVMASVKHFALYGAVEGGRDYNVVDMSPQRMYQDYLPPYRAAVDAGAGGVMVALNTVNGVPASANRWLLRDLLRDDWGFRGLNISDHGAIDELLRHGVARDGREAARLAIPCHITDISLEQLQQADELFVCNSVYGVWPVRAFADLSWPVGPLTRKLQGIARTGPYQRSRGIAGVAGQPCGTVKQLHTRAHGELQQILACGIGRLGRNVQQVEIEHRFAVGWQRCLRRARCIGNAIGLALMRLQQARVGRGKPERRAHVLRPGMTVTRVHPHLHHGRLVATVACLHCDVATLACVVHDAGALQRNRGQRGMARQQQRHQGERPGCNAHVHCSPAPEESAVPAARAAGTAKGR